MYIKAVRSTIKGCDSDSTGRLHVLFGGALKTYHLWTDNEELMKQIIYHHQVKGASFEMPPTPCILTFNEVTLEIEDFTADR